MNGDFINSHFADLKNRILKNSPLTGRNEREVDGLFCSKNLHSRGNGMGYLFLMWQRLSINRAMDKIEILTSSGDGL